MTEFLLAAAGFILLTVAVGLLRILGGPGNVDRTMAAQLLGTGGIAALLLVAAATGVRGAEDVALGLALSRCLRLGRLREQRRPTGKRRSGMSVAIDIFTVVAICAGAVFFLAGTVGLLRFPDSFTRLHALTKADNLGLGLIVLGLLPQADGLLGALKLVAVWVLVQLASATVAQLIAHALRRAKGHRT